MAAKSVVSGDPRRPAEAAAGPVVVHLDTALTLTTLRREHLQFPLTSAD